MRVIILIAMMCIVLTGCGETGVSGPVDFFVLREEQRLCTDWTRAKDAQGNERLTVYQVSSTQPHRKPGANHRRSIVYLVRTVPHTIWPNPPEGRVEYYDTKIVFEVDADGVISLEPYLNLEYVK